MAGPYLRLSDFGLAPVVLDELLSHEGGFPGTLAGGEALGGEAVLAHERLADVLLHTLLLPQQVVLGQQAPVLTRLCRAAQVQRTQKRQNVQR